MISRIDDRFVRAYGRLPASVQRKVKRAYALFRDNPSHPSLEFKPIRSRAAQRLYSAKVDEQYRVLDTLADGQILWFWVGPHTEYDRLVS